jgi:hypothetical protein
MVEKFGHAYCVKCAEKARAPPAKVEIGPHKGTLRRRASTRRAFETQRPRVCTPLAGIRFDHQTREVRPADAPKPVFGAPQPEAKRFCTSCGSPFPGGKFCGNCGAKAPT